MPVDCIEKLKADLAAAQDAYRDLMMGKSVRTVVDQNGERLEFTAANPRNLLNYINMLKQQLAVGDCSGIGISGGSRPVGFLF